MISMASLKFNDIIIAQAAQRNLADTDIFEVSQAVSRDQALTAVDGLHPSGAQYKLWSDAIYDTLKQTRLLQPQS